MSIPNLHPKTHLSPDTKEFKAFQRISILIQELTKRDLNEACKEALTATIIELNEAEDSRLAKVTSKQWHKLVKVIEREMKLVPKNYYRNFWMMLGLSVFGIPLGVALGTTMGNMGLLGIGLPFGLILGVGVGTNMDKKAADEGRQLSVEWKL